MSYPLRLPEALQKRVTQQAASLGLSVNRFLVLVLEEHFRRNPDSALGLKIIPGPQDGPSTARAPNPPPQAVKHKRR